MKKWNAHFTLLVMAGLSLAAISRAAEFDNELDDPTADIVEFHIADGTGAAPWNTRATIVKVKVGQTLRIVNDDSVKHRLHTFNNRPCAHQGPDSDPGQFYDCVVATPADPDVDLMYDHNAGAKSRFYLRAIK